MPVVPIRPLARGFRRLAAGLRAARTSTLARAPRIAAAVGLKSNRAGVAAQADAASPGREAGVRGPCFSKMVATHFMRWPNAREHQVFPVDRQFSR